MSAFLSIGKKRRVRNTEWTEGKKERKGKKQNHENENESFISLALLTVLAGSSLLFSELPARLMFKPTWLKGSSPGDPSHSISGISMWLGEINSRLPAVPYQYPAPIKPPTLNQKKRRASFKHMPQQMRVPTSIIFLYVFFPHHQHSYP